MTPKTYLGQKGYSVYKDTISVEEQQFIRDELTVKPYTPKALVQPPAFSIYRESPQKLYMPRYFGVNNFGIENINKLTTGESINLDFKGELRDYQKNIVNVYMDNTKTSGGGLLEIPCGRGKCLAKGTQILMYDGTIKNVEDIITTDVIMGDDSTPRNILSTTSGVEQMYDICLDVNNEKYTVNESHILSLKSTADYNNVIKQNNIIDISVKEYLDLPINIKNILYGYKVGVEFNKKKIETDPYLFGYWLISNNKTYTKIEVDNNLATNPFFNFLLKNEIITN